MFAVAQLNLLDAVERECGRRAEADDRLAYVRSVDQSLAERHHRGLRYPPTMLVAALANTLAGASVGDSVQRAENEAAPIRHVAAARIAAAYRRDIKRQPELLAGVREGLARLHAAESLVLVVTEGSREHVRSVSKAHGLSPFIDRVIEAPKTRRLFELLGRIESLVDPIFMVGDQLGRDIEPAQHAGIVTVHVPGCFKPRWEELNSHIQPAVSAANFAEAATSVLGQWPPHAASRR